MVIWCSGNFLRYIKVILVIMGDMKSQLATAYSQVRLPVSGLVAFNWAVGHGSHGNPQTMQAVAKTPVTLYNLKSRGLVLPRTIHTTHWTWRSLAGAYTEPSPLRSSVWCGKVLCRLPKKKHRHQHSPKQLTGKQCLSLFCPKTRPHSEDCQKLKTLLP